MSETIIDKVQKNKNKFLQIEEFERVTEILKEHSQHNNDDIVDSSGHDNIFKDDVRKSIFMLNIKKIYNKFKNKLFK